MSASDQEDLEHGLFSGIPVPWESVLGLIKVWFSHVFFGFCMRESRRLQVELFVTCILMEVAPKLSDEDWTSESKLSLHSISNMPPLASYVC